VFADRVQIGMATRLPESRDALLLTESAECLK
jgi:hypothetical protein